jgi:hypothetical protein
LRRRRGFGPDGLERRRAQRIPARGGVPLVSVVGAELLRVSPYGMMIESPLPLEMDTVLKLRLIVAGEKADVEARVAACALGTTGDRRRFGVGLEFTRIAPKIRARLAQVLADARVARDAVSSA